MASDRRDSRTESYAERRSSPNRPDPVRIRQTMDDRKAFEQAQADQIMLRESLRQRPSGFQRKKASTPPPRTTRIPTPTSFDIPTYEGLLGRVLSQIKALSRR